MEESLWPTLGIILAFILGTEQNHENTQDSLCPGRHSSYRLRGASSDHFTACSRVIVHIFRVPPSARFVSDHPSHDASIMHINIPNTNFPVFVKHDMNSVLLETTSSVKIKLSPFLIKHHVMKM